MLRDCGQKGKKKWVGLFLFLDEMLEPTTSSRSVVFQPFLMGSFWFRFDLFIFVLFGDFFGAKWSTMGESACATFKREPKYLNQRCNKERWIQSQTVVFIYNFFFVFVPKIDEQFVACEFRPVTLYPTASLVHLGLFFSRFVFCVFDVMGSYPTVRHLNEALHSLVIIDDDVNKSHGSFRVLVDGRIVRWSGTKQK